VLFMVRWRVFFFLGKGGEVRWGEVRWRVYGVQARTRAPFFLSVIDTSRWMTNDARYSKIFKATRGRHLNCAHPLVFFFWARTSALRFAKIRWSKKFWLFYRDNATQNKILWPSTTLFLVLNLLPWRYLEVPVVVFSFSYPSKKLK
jgi:hypothetical protein